MSKKFGTVPGESYEPHWDHWFRLFNQVWLIFIFILLFIAMDRIRIGVLEKKIGVKSYSTAAPFFSAVCTIT